MLRRSPIVRSTLVLIAVALIGGGAYYLGASRHSTSIPKTPLPSPTAPPTTTTQAGVTVAPVATPPLSGQAVVWKNPPSGLAQGDGQALLAALRSLHGGHVVPASATITITSARLSHGWGALYGDEQATGPHAAQPTSQFVFLARKAGAVWHVSTYGDADFCSLLHSLPAMVMSQTGKAYFIGCRPAGQ